MALKNITNSSIADDSGNLVINLNTKLKDSTGNNAWISSIGTAYLAKKLASSSLDFNRVITANPIFERRITSSTLTTTYKVTSSSITTNKVVTSGITANAARIVNKLNPSSITVDTNITATSGKFYISSITATGKVTNAVWNDLAEFREICPSESKVSGKCYYSTKVGLCLTQKKAQLGTVGVFSDTYGFSLGSANSSNKIPIGISGWVLAYVDKEYPIGTALVSSKSGFLTKANFLDKLFRNERIVGIVDSNNKGYNGINTKNRTWIKIK